MYIVTLELKLKSNQLRIRRQSCVIIYMHGKLHTNASRSVTKYISHQNKAIEVWVEPERSAAFD